MAELRLRPMTADEFRVYHRHSVAAYADNMVRNVRLSPEAAQARSAAVFHDLLPEGLGTRDHWIEVAEDEHAERVAVLWFARRVTPAGDIAYLFDIEVEEAMRGRGHGRRVMELFEQEVGALGLGRIELNVFGHNDVARSLYEGLGYVEMSRQLFKELDAR
ncbi:MAG: GNAT family N-acetyltransferase [Actinomycetota bacterium]